jgi:hypothetical protein
MEEKSMALALLISFFLPGLGVAYVGDIRKGIIIFAASVICGIISIYFAGMFFGLIRFILWVYGIYATYQEVKLYNGS